MGKESLRQEMKKRLSKMSAKEAARLSGRIRGHLDGCFRRLKPGSVMFFAGIPGEPQLLDQAFSLAQEGTKVFLPRMDGGRITQGKLPSSPAELVEGPWGVQEPPSGPENVEGLALILIPGLGFDRGGARLGRGGGHFDRFLAGHQQAHKIGVCFSIQVAEALPRENHDIMMDAVVTEQGFLELKKK